MCLYIVDSADTPDRIAVALHALRQHQFGACTAVVDLSPKLHPHWRTRLGEVLEKSGVRVVLTGAGLAGDEAPSVAMDVLGGLRNPGRHEVIANRAQAIRWAVNHTDRGCILLAGCGVESWMSSEEELSVTDESVARVGAGREAVAHRRRNAMSKCLSTAHRQRRNHLSSFRVALAFASVR